MRRRSRRAGTGRDQRGRVKQALQKESAPQTRPERVPAPAGLHRRRPTADYMTLTTERRHDGGDGRRRDSPRHHLKKLADSSARAREDRPPVRRRECRPRSLSRPPDRAGTPGSRGADDRPPIKAAKFPAIKSLESFDFDAIPALNKKLVLDLARASLSDVARTSSPWVPPASARPMSPLASASPPASAGSKPASPQLPRSCMN